MEKEKVEKVLESFEKNNDIRDKETRKVRVQENNTPVQLVKTYDDSELEW